tara:strand:- start:21755 stop:22702 length:948 start_codon:yes stop_codon:yes gene_type:complete
MKKERLTELLNIEYPIIMAPMFLVTNKKMMIEALNSGIAACIPALNFRTIEKFEKAINEIRDKSDSTGLGVNLIANKSNRKLKEQLNSCLKLKVDFIITSLGSPEDIINKCKSSGIKVFCDVVEDTYAKKVAKLGADAVIAVNKNAGGHAGALSSKELFSCINNVCDIPIISAGGVGSKLGVEKKLSEGFSGLSIGSPFIACDESDISEEYKKACIKYGKNDIVLTTKISGTPCTVINTPYVQQVGTEQNWMERILSKNKNIKKWIKMLTFLKGMRSIENAALSSTYKTVWCAGPSIEHTTEILSVKEIVKRLTT